jgi:hypothetical protein
MEDEDGDKRAKFFEDKKRERERQLKERKKRLDGSDSEGDEGSVKEGEQTQMGAYDSLTLLGTTTCNTPSQTKGTPETELISSELNKIELNKSTNSPLRNENSKTTNPKEPQANKINRSGSLTDDNDDIELDYDLFDEEDSLTNLEHMQENSLDAHFDVGDDKGLPVRTDNQEENPVGSSAADTQEKDLIVTKTEPTVGEIIVKVEPESRSQVITADFFRRFLESGLVRGKTPINQKDEREFIRILKEQFSQALKPYKTPLNTYPFDEEVAHSVFIALHTEERNRTQLFKHNEYSLQHIKQLLQYGEWQEELKKNIETEIISRLDVLDRPLKQFASIVQEAHKELKNELDSYNQERQSNLRQKTKKEGFLTDLWEESEMNASDSRIKMLMEDNGDLTKELKSKNRSLEESEQLVKKLKKEKNEWQELYLQLAPGKRPAENVRSEPPSDKRSRRNEGGDPSRESSSVEVTSGNRRGNSRWDRRPVSPVPERISKRRMSEGVIEMWKEQCRRLRRYIPDKPNSGPRHPYPEGFNHSTNISILLSAATNFKRLTEEFTTWEEKTAFGHDCYIDLLKRNFIPTYTATYEEIKNHPEMALTHRCSPLSHYYMAIVRDSPGYQERRDTTGAHESGSVSIKRNLPVPHSPPPQTTSRNESNKSIGDHRRDGRDDTKGNHPHRIAMTNRDIPFPDPQDLSEEEKILIQNLNSDVTMIENGEHTEQYVEWRRQEIIKANHWWTDGFDRPFWHERFEEPVSPNDKKVQDRFDIAHLANCNYKINEIRLKAFNRHPLQRDGPSGQGNK